MVGAMAACEWVHFAYLEMRNANFTLAALRRKLRGRLRRLAENLLRQVAFWHSRKTPTETLGITDAK